MSCPKAYASIGRALTPTLIDRSIEIHMRRKMPTEIVAEFSIAELGAVTEGLRDRLEQLPRGLHRAGRHAAIPPMY